MEPSTYNAFADMLAKFHTSPALIQALWLVAVPAMVFGVTWCLSQVLRDAIRALSGRRAPALDLTAIEEAAAPRLAAPDQEMPRLLNGPGGGAEGAAPPASPGAERAPPLG